MFCTPKNIARSLTTLQYQHGLNWKQKKAKDESYLITTNIHKL
jgi:hypothetical protein